MWDVNCSVDPEVSWLVGDILLMLHNIKTNTDFLHLPSKDVKSRDWEKERKKLISYDLHCATLGEYHRQARIPRGLRCNLRPTLFSDNEKYCTTFQKILNKCSFDIILLTIEYLQEAIKSTEEKIESIETQLTATLNSTELSTLKNKIDASLVSYQRSLEERKRTKFQRDTEDYLSNKVYRWEDTAPRRPRPRYRRKQGDNYPSGGSSPAGGSSAGSGSETGGAQAIGPRFLGQTARPLGGEGRRNGNRHMTLRSQEAGIDRNTHDLCIDLLNLVLRENFFLFEDDFFVQTCGTAMGSNVAPAYANLYMDNFEREYVYANPIFQQNAIVWYRYIDDIFCIWQGQLTLCTTNLYDKRVLDGTALFILRVALVIEETQEPELVDGTGFAQPLKLGWLDLQCCPVW
ncbi:unnamed protein product [Ranitomeya imitator]|uniref:Reverse transcriptase domain-containing protein n=1 Tax=Ranitomeya imitator TaxID=111125 RepID=A0ABN9L4D0_9NEOB|nr:unnamed protein product [Ranitomeya imitator]